MSVIDRDQYFTSLPQSYYTSEQQFAEDMEKIWRRQWIYAGHVSQAKNPGDFFTFDFLNESVIIVRAQDGELHALNNSCRHRGMRLCDGAGHNRRIVCPYHSWTYGLDGTLLTTSPQQGELPMEHSDLSLVPVQISVWQGLIFVCYSPKPLRSVEEMVGPEGTAEMARLEPEKMKIIRETVYPTTANWKLLFENGVECYHCTSVHPEFCEVLDPAGMTGYYSDDLAPDLVPELVQSLVLPIRCGKDTLSLDGNLVCKKLLGEFGAGAPIPPDYSGSGFMTQPGYTWGDFHPDHAMIANCFPVGPMESEFVVTWLVHEEAIEGVDYEVDTVAELWDITHRQDAGTLGLQQRGILSSAYTPGPDSATAEPGIKIGLDLYLKMLADSA